MITTLNKIRESSPCADGWTKLLKHLNKTQADNEPLLISTIVESNGIDDALWCLRAVDDCDKEMRLFAVWCARQVQHLMTDQRSFNALDVAERFANGQATQKELNAAWDAGTAAWDAGTAARAAAGAAWDAAWDAARAAAWAAASASASAAGEFADGFVAGSAAKALQKQELLRICVEWESARTQQGEQA